MKLIVDIGNSRTKLALFNKKDLIKHEITSEFSKNFLSNFCDNHLISSSIFSSVRKLNEADHRLISAYNGLLLDSKTPIPIQSNYKSSIGTDRLSAVVGANYLFPNKNIWVFDAGTCLTADYIDKKKTYHGGRITLGIEMRYKALNKHTSKLPNLELSEKSFFKGDTTENSIISGVQQGILAEVRTLISDFEKFNNDFIVLFTGGDSSFFEKELKNTIFADQFLVLKGLNEILDYNE